MNFADTSRQRRPDEDMPREEEEEHLRVHVFLHGICIVNPKVGPTTWRFKLSKASRQIKTQCPGDVICELRSQYMILCKTGGMVRHDAVEVFRGLYAAVVVVFQDIVDAPLSWNSDSVREASPLQWAVINLKFLIASAVCCNGLRCPAIQH